MILVVDDHPDICHVMELLLAHAGIPARCVTSPRTALSILDAPPPPSAVILDNHMPEISGLEILKIIRSRPDLQAVPVVMLSADADPAMIKESERLGAQAYYIKGQISFPDLVKTMRGLTRGEPS